MIKFVIRTDCHVSDKSPQSRVDDYLETCLDKLSQVGTYAAEFGAMAVLDNGDFFHNKASSKNSHEMVRRVIDMHNEFYACPVYVNPGNHDFPYNNIDYLQRQPLQVLFSAKVFERMTDHTFDQDGVKVRVVGFPYKSHFEVEEFNIERGDEDFLIACVHASATPDGRTLFAGTEESLSYLELAKCSPDMYVFGHLHFDQGIQVVKGTTFMNLGSMTRGSLVDDNLSRIPRFGALTVYKEDGQVRHKAEAVEYRVKDSSEIFDLTKHERMVAEKKDLEHFIKTLSMQSGEGEEEDILNSIRGLDEFQREVRDRAIQYLEQDLK